MKSLQTFLSRERLLALAGEKVYQRGSAYHEDGQVRLDQHFTSHAIGEVAGTQPYRVELKFSGTALEAECTCPAMADYGFCKHAVAMGLFVIDAPPPIKGRAKPEPPDRFTQAYPHLAAWVRDGWIEIGRDGCSTSMIRVMDEGGVMWEGGTRHKSLHRILLEADEAIAGFFED